MGDLARAAERFLGDIEERECPTCRALLEGSGFRVAGEMLLQSRRRRKDGRGMTAWRHTGIAGGRLHSRMSKEA